MLFSFPSTASAETIPGSIPERDAFSDLKIQSDGWSGKIIYTDAADLEDRTFQFDVSASLKNTYVAENPIYELSGSGGYVNQTNQHKIVGISLEHMGKQVAVEDRHVYNTLYGHEWDEQTSTQGALTNSFGGAANAALSLDCRVINIANVHRTMNETEQDLTDVNFYNLNFMGYYDLPYDADLNPIASANRSNTTHGYITTDLPIFATDADLKEFIDSDGMKTDKMLNFKSPTDEYLTHDQCWFIHNVIGHNTKDRNSYTEYSNYQFWPKNGRICLYRSTPSASDPYALRLLNYTGYTTLKAGAWDENFVEYTGEVHSKYMTKSAQYAANDYYTVFVNAETATNIPIFDTFDEAIEYIQSRIDIEQASNYSDIAIAESVPIEPDFGTVDAETEIGTNEQVYNIAGFHLYEVSHTELSSFFLEIFNTDPDVVDAILEGTKLFSGNEINAIMMCMYLPISDISKICTMGSTSKITVGTWRADHSEGKTISKNNIMIDMGSAVYPYRYHSEQDFEPYNQLYVQLPYCGTHQLQISKYIGKTIHCKYAVSVADGSCKALLFADDILMDEFAGNMGSMRPITAADAAQYVSNIVNGVMDMVPGIGAAGNTVAKGAEAAAAGSVAGMAGAVAGAGGVAASGVWKGYELLQAAETPPMSTHGGLSGAIGYFGVQKPHFIIAERKCIRPANEQAVIGYPSGQGGKINTFSGYLKCSAVKLNGFPGTKEELAELYNILSQGIYLN